MYILTLNCGSSSVKYARFACGSGRKPGDRIGGMLEGINAQIIRNAIGLATEGIDAKEVIAIGHRVVHGGTKYFQPTIIDDEVIRELDGLSPLAPLHQPVDLEGIRISRGLMPDAKHIACFDTAFHHGHPFVHATYGLPRRFFDAGVRRYGFHGLSYEFIVQSVREEFPELAQARLLVAHLGSGASICAIHHQQSIACTMGFSALGGLVMGTRCGDLDPGVVLYLLEAQGLSARAISELLYRESGLKGLSGISSDMRTLLVSNEAHAQEAIDYFVARCQYEIGGLASTIGGVDALIFTGGIGEHAWQIREKIVRGLDWLGLYLNPDSNRSHERLISSVDSEAKILCLPTDEEAMIAQQVSLTIADSIG